MPTKNYSNSNNSPVPPTSFSEVTPNDIITKNKKFVEIARKLNAKKECH